MEQKTVCFVNDFLDRFRKSEKGFMGRSHVLSAIFVMSLAFWARHRISEAIAITSVAGLFIAAQNIMGGSLTPDLDNTNSTAESTLGLLGNPLSWVFRTISAFVQNIVRSKRDEGGFNPHRGFFHTIPGNALIGVGLWFLFGMKGKVFSIRAIGNQPGGTVTWGWLFALIFTSIMFNMSLWAVAKNFVKRLQRRAGIFSDFAGIVFCLFVNFFLFSTLPLSTNYQWIAVAFVVGCIIHVIGDTFTTAGTPIFFPIPIKGKLWWRVRIFPLKVNDESDGIIAKLLIGMTIVSIVLQLLFV